MCLSFFAEKVILELKCTNHFFRASKNTNSVFCNKQIKCEATDAQKIFLSEKKLLNAILRASKNTNSVFSATKQIMRMRGHRCSKLFLSEKKLLNAI